MVKSSSISAGKQSLRQRWASPPQDLPPREERFYIIIVSALPLGWLVHFFYIFLFAYWEVWPLAVFNFFSVIIYTTSIVFWRRQQWLNLATLLILVELFLHAAIAVVLVGWGFGSQYWLFIIPSIVALDTNLARWATPTASIFCGLIF